MTSRYHGSKISGSQTPFLIEMAIDERWKPNYMGHRFGPECSLAQESLTCQFFSCHICRTTVCRDPEILLP